MSNPTAPKPRRKLTSLELSAPARGALRRLKRNHGITFTHAIERGVLAMETNLNQRPDGQPQMEEAV